MSNGFYFIWMRVMRVLFVSAVAGGYAHWQQETNRIEH